MLLINYFHITHAISGSVRNECEVDDEIYMYIRIVFTRYEQHIIYSNISIPYIQISEFGYDRKIFIYSDLSK